MISINMMTTAAIAEANPEAGVTGDFEGRRVCG
jgi:hypothetical protein